MSKTILFQLLIAVITITGYSAQTVSSDFVDGRIYLKLKPNSSIDLHNYDNSDASLNSIITEFDVTSTTRAFQSDAPTMRLIHRIEFTAITRIDELISSLSGLPYVEFAEKAPLFKLVHTPNDYNTDAKNHLNIISAQLAWDIEKGSQNIILAVVDNAVNHTHEDLIANRWVNTGEVAGNFFDDDLNGYTDDVYGYDVADGDGNTIPPSGGAAPFVHGTHVAGIAAATSNNATGISSIGYNLSIMSVKCSPDAGDGNTLPNAYEGVDYAIKAGANIINMSFGGPGQFLTWDVIVNQAESMGVMLIAAAGNDNTDDVSFPAGYPYVFSVGATDENDKRASFSNYGSTIDVMAPGVSIYSTFWPSNNSYGYLSGTSMSSPLTAGLAGLIWSYDSSFSVAQIKQFLKLGCDNINDENPGYNGQLGSGRINAFKSLQLASGLTLEEINNDNFSFEIYPNPSNGNFFLRPNQTLPETSQLTIYDAMGRVVHLQNLDPSPANEALTVKGEGLLQGLYFLRLAIGDVNLSHRIMVR